MVLSLALVSHVLMVVKSDRLPSCLTRRGTEGLIGLGLGMATGSMWVTATVLLVCAAYWFRRPMDDDSFTTRSSSAGGSSLLKEALLLFAILSVLALGFELRGALPML